LAQICGKEKRGQWMSMYLGMLLFGSIFGPTFGGVLADMFDIRMPFFAYALITGLGIIPTLVLPNLANSQTEIPSFNLKQIQQDVRQVIASPSFLSVTFAIFTLFFLRTGIRSTLVPLFAANNLGLTSGDIGLVLTFGAIATALTMTPIGSISDRIGRKRPLAACLVLSAVSILFIHSATDILTLSVIMMVYGAVVGLSGPSAAYVTDVSPPDKLEISMGVYRMISDSGFFVGPLLLGFVADITATPVPGASHSGLIEIAPFVLASIILIIALLVLSRARDPARETLNI
ncbi:MAG: MFS transporter, partial [Candidatus Thorarchaeota archaeon]|nr:MFS transporter [Candidatus Thorarchaeota archaeon]